VVAWDVAEVESAPIAADLVQRACLKERYHHPSGFGNRQCQQPPLILHADNGNAMRGATLESRLEEMGVLRSFSRPRVSNDNPTQNHCSVRSNTGLITPAGPLPARTRPANG
jgi:putative transposase